MTTPQRSTRRSVNPPEGEQKPGEDGDHTHNLAEVESILDEIENLVSRKNREKDETAISTPVFEEQNHVESEHLDMMNDPETDLGRLEKELQSAIATELEKSPERNDSRSGSEDEDEIKKLTEVFEEAESNRSENDEPGDPDRSPITEEVAGSGEESISEHQVPVEMDQESKLLRVLARPMQGLSPTTRLIVNITAVTMALWVPIIWLVVLGGGLSSPEPEALNSPTTDVADETISEPNRQEKIATEDT
ncbi:MAG: hypothetical protein CMJ40_02935 [Phycisphaerae bacterium]|nr:hypothetical protein [Phycisphaerae bacterium]HAW94908.1 hypothetical protein [Phycisphaerales bacterium]